MRTSLDIARLSRENSSATFETGPLQELRRQLESLSTLGSADALGDFGTNTAAAAAAAAAMEAALDGGGGGARADARRAFAAGEAEVHVAHQEHRCAHR